MESYTHLSCSMVRVADDTLVAILTFRTSRGTISVLNRLLQLGETRHLSEQIIVNSNHEYLRILVMTKGYWRLLTGPVTFTQSLEWKSLEKLTALRKKTALRRHSALNIKGSGTFPKWSPWLPRMEPLLINCLRLPGNP